MFWILKKSRLTSGAASFFNSLNNNVTSPTNGYNKLRGTDEENRLNFNETKKSVVYFESTKDEYESDSSSYSSDMFLEDEISQDSDTDENLTCNVCDRFFCSPNQLSQHQQKKRHFGCTSCDSLFSSLMALEHHKEEFEHWSGSERLRQSISDDSDLDISTHEMERLL